MEVYYGGFDKIRIPPLFSEKEIIIRVSVDRCKPLIDVIIDSTKKFRRCDFNIDPRSLISVPLNGGEIVDVVFFKYDENKTSEPDHCQPYIKLGKEKYGDEWSKVDLDVKVIIPSGCNVVELDLEMQKRNLIYDPVAIMMAYESGLKDPEKMRSTTIWKTSANSGHFLSYNHDSSTGVLMQPISDWANSPGRKMRDYMWYAGVRGVK
jgi:hypothetical protein